MERCEWRRCEIPAIGDRPARVVKRYEWRFTAEETQALEAILSEHDPRAVYRCIRHLEFHCQDLILILDAPARADLRRDRQAALAHLTKTMELLKQMQRATGNGAFVLDRTRSLTEIADQRETIAGAGALPPDAWETIFPLVPQALDALEPIVAAIEGQQEPKAGRRGRPDADALGLARTVALVLREHLQIEPTTYPEGPFACTLRVCLAAVGLPAEDPARAIRHAVESLRM